MNTQNLNLYFQAVSKAMAANKDELVALDQVFGDGDLGISMDDGFAAAAKYTADTAETDLGRYFLDIAHAFNEAAPSSLGTIVAFVFMGMAKSLKGKKEASLKEFAEALKAGEENIMKKAESKLNEKTMLDALDPAVNALLDAAASGMESSQALQEAAKAADQGAEATVDMIAVHGRAAYHTDKTIGHMDGGAKMISIAFDAVAKA
jgi:Dihydroxyacetone kinase